MALARFSCSRNRPARVFRPDRAEAGFSLIEVLIAIGVVTTALVALAQLFAMSTRANYTSRSTTIATTLATQKLEQLRGLTWGFDNLSLPVSDTQTDLSANPPAAIGGTGLQPSPGNTLGKNWAGYVDYLDEYGNSLGGGETVPGHAVWIRRWSIEPLPTDPNNTLILQVLVTRNKARGAADEGAVARLGEEARLMTVKTRKAK